MLGPEPPVPRPVLLYRSELSQILKARQADFSFHNPRQFLGGTDSCSQKTAQQEKMRDFTRVEQSSHGSTGTPSGSCLLTPVTEAPSVSRSLTGAVNPAVTRRQLRHREWEPWEGGGSCSRVPCCCHTNSELAQTSLGRQDLERAFGGKGREGEGQVGRVVCL